MKKFLVLCVSALLCAGHAYSYVSGPTHSTYKVTVQNLTKGQPLTPPVVVVHSSKFKAFQLGGQASAGLADLAQDGITATIREEFDTSPYVSATAVGSGVIMPGEKQEILITVSNERGLRDYLSVLSMLARTNDAFIAATSRLAAVRPGASYSLKPAQVYDAGVEQNSEDCAHIPAPPCGNHNVGTGGGEGFVRPHEGLHLQSDLNGQRDTFANIAAQIKIKRVN